MNNIESWRLYFPEDDYNPKNGNVILIDKCKKKLQKYLDLYNQDIKHIFYDKIELNIFTLSTNANVYTTLTAIAKIVKEETLYTNTDTALKCIKAAITDLYHSYTKSIKQFNLKILTYEELSDKYRREELFITKFSNITADKIDNFTYLKGTIVKVGPKKVKIHAPVYRCIRCRQIITNSLDMTGDKSMSTDQKNVYKTIKGCTCKNKKYEIVLELSRIIDYQEVKLQEYDSPNPNFIDLLLFDDIVGSVSPGDVISLSGIIKAEPDANNLYKLVIHVNNLYKVKDTDTRPQHKFNGDKITVSDLELFKEISKTPNLFVHFKQAIFPDIIGHSHILKGLILALFGGHRKTIGSSKVRSDIHVLLIGDPGLGKSKMLLDMVDVIPKSTYICGTLTTTAGLTISLTFENGDYVVEAGALVISDGGICAIDEFDKMPSTAVLESMEDQMVSVAKGGIVCTIPTKSSIIAAANPRFGKFDNSRKVSKKIEDSLNFERNLISRFDLVFVLVDDENSARNNIIKKIKEDILKKSGETKNTVNETNTNINKTITESYLNEMKKAKEKKLLSLLDEKNTEIDLSTDSFEFEGSSSKFSEELVEEITEISENVEEIQENNNKSQSKMDLLFDDIINIVNVRNKPIQTTQVNDLINEIRSENVNLTSILDDLDIDIETKYDKPQLIKYIIYARNNLKPQLTESAKTKIKKFFGNLQNENITLRTLESLIRLTEAHAKMHLKNEADENDAISAINIFKNSFYSGKKMNENLKVEKTTGKMNFIEMLQNMNKKEFNTKELEGVYEKCNIKKSFIAYIEMLNNKGVLLKKNKNLYRLCV